VVWRHHRLNFSSGRRTEIKSQTFWTGCRFRVIAEEMIAEREVDPSHSLNNRTVAHPATGCGSNNNGGERETTCKNVTGDNPCRQPALPMKNIAASTSKEDGSALVTRERSDRLRLDMPDAGQLESGARLQKQDRPAA
jgi:hypothetical protein